MFLYADVPLGN